MFDPLHKWLGIPPDQQPPNHYRLLGIDLFESDPDVIDAAADKQLTFLHQLTGDEYAEDAETISNQVSIARLCLLNPEKKEIYDSSLNRIAKPAANPVVLDPSSPARDVQPRNVQPRNVQPRNVQPRRVMRSKPRSPWGRISAICGIVILLMLVLGIQQGRLVLDVSRLFQGHVSSDVSSDAPARIKAAPPKPISRATSTAKPSPRMPDVSPPSTVQPMATPQSTARDAASQAQQRSSQTSTGDVELSTKSAPKPRRTLADLLHNTEPEQESMGDSAVQQPVPKAPLPSKSALADKMALVRDLYQDLYRSAKSSDQRIELARQMHRDGELTSDDPVGRFALWQVSRDIFSGQGRFNSAMAIADNMSTFYSGVDAETLKLESLKAASAKVAPSGLDEFYNATMQFADQCCDIKRHAVATDAIVFMLQTFGDRLDFSRIENAKLVRDQAMADGQRHREFQQAIARLAEGPDSNANDTVGKYLAFVRADWDEAIYYLAESSIESLAAAGKSQIAFQSDEASAIDVADAWYVASESIDNLDEKKQILRHALAFYETAAGASEGLVKRKAEQNIAKIKDSLGNQLESEAIDSTSSDVDDASGTVLGYRIYHSSESKSDFAKRRRNQFSIGMGDRPGGIGEAAVGVELRSIDAIEVTGSASHDAMTIVDAFSKTGFMIDYHTPGGYTKRVFLGLGISPGREFSVVPAWGTGGKPEAVTDIGKSGEYKIDLTRWAPPTWDRRCWVTLYMQNAGEGRSIEAEMKW